MNLALEEPLECESTNSIQQFHYRCNRQPERGLEGLRLLELAASKLMRQEQPAQPGLVTGFEELPGQRWVFFEEQLESGWTPRNPWRATAEVHFGITLACSEGQLESGWRLLNPERGAAEVPFGMSLNQKQGPGLEELCDRH